MQELVTRLQAYLPELREGRNADSFTNDLFEATDDLIDLAQHVMQGDTRFNYPARVSQELKLWQALRANLAKATARDAERYAPLFENAEQILAFVQGIGTPEGGHLGFVRVVREKFAFFQTYGLSVVEEEPVRVRFSSGQVFVDVAWAKNVSSSCVFGPEANQSTSFWIDDLLYLYRDPRYKTLPDELVLDTEAAIENWTDFLAGVFRQYGHDLLSNRSGIFAELAAAQESRDAEYRREMDRLHDPASHGS
jgi:hypothetical protein